MTYHIIVLAQPAGVTHNCHGIDDIDTSNYHKITWQLSDFHRGTRKDIDTYRCTRCAAMSTYPVEHKAPPLSAKWGSAMATTWPCHPSDPCHHCHWHDTKKVGNAKSVQSLTNCPCLPVKPQCPLDRSAHRTGISAWMWHYGLQSCTENDNREI